MALWQPVDAWGMRVLLSTDVDSNTKVTNNIKVTIQASYDCLCVCRRWKTLDVHPHINRTYCFVYYQIVDDIVTVVRCLRYADVIFNRHGFDFSSLLTTFRSQTTSMSPFKLHTTVCVHCRWKTLDVHPHINRTYCFYLHHIFRVWIKDAFTTLWQEIARHILFLGNVSPFVYICTPSHQICVFTKMLQAVSLGFMFMQMSFWKLFLWHVVIILNIK